MSLCCLWNEHWLGLSLATGLLLLVLLFSNWADSDAIPALDVPLLPAESQNDIEADRYNVSTKVAAGQIPCYDPATMQMLGFMPAMSKQQVQDSVQKARAASQEWRHSSFRKRKLLLKTILKYIVDHKEAICRVSSQDSGKTAVDAAFGEVMVTCEKIWWLLRHGERWLKPEKRGAGIMMFYKAARVEYHPLGVVGAIVPWNYPFHNVLNPLTAAVFAGDAIVIKVSEHASWSAQYYGRIVKAALAACGAPEGLVQIVTGYAEAGQALVTSGVDKLVFVGSTGVGKAVMRSAADTLTPVVLELGGKDAFIVCDDADLKQAVPTALRGCFQACGQNCAGAERFLVHNRVYTQFVQQVSATCRKMRQGPTLGPEVVDAGAMCMPGLAERVHELVQDAVSHGAKVLVGGVLGKHASGGQFYQPTVLVGVTSDMRIWREEVFGPVLVVVEVKSDEEAISLANDCDFGLGSSVWSRNRSRAIAIAGELQAGMTSINDFAATYMCQSLPFGGVKHSGFDRFAGIEGLRGMCVAKAVCEDRWPWLIRTDIPPLLQYPLSTRSFAFVSGLIDLFYAPAWSTSLKGIRKVILAVTAKS